MFHEAEIFQTPFVPATLTLTAVLGTVDASILGINELCADKSAKATHPLVSRQFALSRPL